VFDHVERRRVLEQPAGKDLAPRERLADAGAFLHPDLDKGAGFGRVFPRQGLLAVGELDDDIADPARFAGFHHQILREVVALVEQAERGDPVLDRGAEIAFHRARRRSAAGEAGRNLCRLGRGIALLAATGEGQRREGEAGKGTSGEGWRPAHGVSDRRSGNQEASGDHAS